MSEIRRVGPPREVAQISEELCRFTVCLNAAPSGEWLRRFHATAEWGECADRPLNQVGERAIVFECAEEDVFGWVRCLDARIAQANAGQRERLPDRPGHKAA